MTRLSSFIAAAIAVSSSMASAPLCAQEAGEGSLYGFYGRVQGGAAFAGDLDQTLGPQPLIADAPSGQIARSSIGYTVGAALGFRYPSGFRTELEYRYVSTPIDDVTTIGGLLPSVTVPSEEDITAHFLMSNVYYDFANTSPVTPFVGVGVGGASVNLPGFGSDAAFAYQGRAGLKVQALEHSSISVEYVYTRTRDLVFEGGLAGDLIASGDQLAVSSALISFQKDF